MFWKGLPALISTHFWKTQTYHLCCRLMRTLSSRRFRKRRNLQSLWREVALCVSRLSTETADDGCSKQSCISAESNSSFLVSLSKFEVEFGAFICILGRLKMWKLPISFVEMAHMIVTRSGRNMWTKGPTTRSQKFLGWNGMVAIIQ